MILEFHNNYEDYTDRELVELVTHPQAEATPNEEGVAYLLYKRYDPLLRKLHLELYDNRHDLYGDCLGDLFAYLKSGEPTWRKLMSLQWRSSFGTWLGITARRRFVEVKPYLIGKSTKPLSINDTPVNLEYEDKEQKVILMEAISLLQDEDQKFVMTKRLQGYNSKEIALLLQKRWAKHGIVKYNNKMQKVIPDAAYVDVRAQRAKENLRKIITTLM